MGLYCDWYNFAFLATTWSPAQGVLPTVLDLVTEMKRKDLWRRPKAQNLAVEPQEIILPFYIGERWELRCFLFIKIP
jgi:hypothetical protein